ncbi:MAG: serine--tRNA ligase, partial [Halalkalicoccus sp.]|nr:serine--tRNA ligase [Halalkalicoccus sp.]
MLDRSILREDPETVRWALDAKGVDIDFDETLAIDEEWRELKAKGDELRHERNEVSSEIGELKQAGKEEEAQAAIERSGELKTELQEIEERADELEERFERALLELPQIPHE